MQELPSGVRGNARTLFQSAKAKSICIPLWVINVLGFLAAAKLAGCEICVARSNALSVSKQLGSEKKWEKGEQSSKAMRHRVATSTPSKHL